MRVVQLLRPKQWTKNLLVFAAPLFVLDALPERAWLLSVLVFVAMCLVSGSVYVANDLMDIERKHYYTQIQPVLQANRAEA